MSKTPKHIRDYIYNRDKVCQTCGIRYKKMTIHHIIFVCNGGMTTPDNLTLLCQNCHNFLHKQYNKQNKHK